VSIALDYTRRIDPGALHAAGVTHVCRYLSWLPNPKVIGQAEFDELHATGIGVLLNWEYDARDWLAGSSAGTSHGNEAVKQARTLGHPAGWPIVGSADLDMTAAQWNGAGKAYGQAFAAAVRDGGYTPGVYGPWDVLTWCQALGGFGVFWQAGMSTSWSSGRNANLWPAAHLRQRGPLTVGGVATDRNDILKEPIAVLTQQDLDAIWNYKIGGTGGPAGANGHREAHYALSDLRDQLLPPYASSYDGGKYGAYNELAGKLDNLLAVLGGGLALTDAQVATLAAAIVAHPDNPLGPADEPAIVTAVKQALREGAGPSPAA
jgi:hypothetical protein